MRTPSTPRPEVAAGTVWRCGGRSCGAGECEHDEDELHRHASGAGHGSHLSQHAGHGQVAGGRRVSQPNDPWELEAERVAGAIDRDDPIEIHGQGAVLDVHRCGDVPSESCPCHDTPAVGEVLRSSGTPLDIETRRLMEERLGHDFGSVRVHADEAAAASAAALEANAYTVGNHVAFARGRYAPGQPEGRRLLAHELTHVVQQDTSAGRIPIGLHRQSSTASPALAPPAAASSACSIRFAHNSTRTVDRDEVDECVERARAYVAAGGDRRIAVHGFASEEGEAGPNTTLSRRRAERVRDLLVGAGVPSSRIDVGGHGEDTSQPTLEANRRVEVVLSESITFPPESVTVAPFVCGPDVTAQVGAAVARARSLFGGWTSDQRTESCEALRSISHGEYAWDIVELHNNAWILGYRPYCGTAGATPPCGSTVQVGTECYYAGSPNYVIFGTMCDLCAGHFRSIGRAGANPGYTGYMDFDRASMEDLIGLYKSGSGNVAESKAWAAAGLAGWPSGGTPPPGDRPGCVPQCTRPYSGAAFRVNWYPHEFHTGAPR